jgi:hypothetical protein
MAKKIPLKKLLYITMLYMCLSLIEPIYPALAGSADVGEIIAVKGKVLINRGTDKQAVVHDKIFLQDIVTTGASSRLKIQFNDDSLLTLKENSIIHIKEYLTKESNGKGRSIIGMSSGALKVLRGMNDFEVHTPTMVAAARGTYFAVWLDYENKMLYTGVAVFEGKVTVHNVNPDIAGSVLVTEGMMTKVFQGRPPLKPFPISTGMLGGFLDCQKDKKSF